MITQLRCPECFNAGTVVLDVDDPDISDRFYLSCQCGWWTSLPVVKLGDLTPLAA